MEKEKKYFWVKLRENFFESGEFRIILGKKDGDRFAFLYMRLLLISISSNGDIMLNENIPYNEELISEAFSLDIETVKEAMKLFKKLNLIQVSKNGILSITTFNKMVGSESAVAERMRKYRLKKLQCNTDVTNCTTEIEIETDTEKDLDLEKEKEQQQQKNKNKKKSAVVTSLSSQKKFIKELLGTRRISADRIIGLEKPLERIEEVIKFCDENDKKNGWLIAALRDDYVLNNYSENDIDVKKFCDFV